MKVIIIHGCPSDKESLLDIGERSYNKHWIPWVRRQLQGKGVDVEVPLMPEPWSPDYEKFKGEFEHSISVPLGVGLSESTSDGAKLGVDEETVLVGHSCGCAFLVRWLGESGKKIKKLILVAPWKIAYREDGSDRDFYGFDIDSRVRDNVGEVVMFTADDEEEDGKKSLGIYREALGGKVIELEGHGHYTLGGMGTEEFPELVGEI